MYWFDTTIVILLGVGGLLGAWSGFIGQMARLLGLGLSIAGTIFFHEPLARFFQEQLLQGTDLGMVRVLTAIMIFGTVYLLSIYFSRLARRGIKEADLEGFDRLLGATFGIVKMSLLVGIISLALATHKHPTSDMIMARSTLAPPFADNMERIVAMVPEECKTFLDESLREIR